VSAIDDLLAVVARLRAPGGCPWDREQTHESLSQPLIEEVAELLDTIDRRDFPHMREELGDVLLQVVFHADLAHEAGHFNFEDVARDIHDKLVRRHPHVFGDVNLADTAAVLRQWESIKVAERAAKAGTATDAPLFKPLPPQLPALFFAEGIFKQMQRKALPVAAVLDTEGIAALAEGLTEDEAGTLLFQVAAACHLAKVDPESALRRHTRQLMSRLQDAASHPATPASV
jgi:MazG family protein